MKKLLLPVSVLTLALISCGLLCSSGCKKDESASAPAEQPKNETAKPAPAAVSAEKTSFQEVTSQLDPGGNFYLYLSTEQLLEGLSGKVSGWRQLFSAIPDATPDTLEKIGKAFDVVTRLIRDSGIEDVSGLGMSSIAREKGFYHSKMLAHHYPGKGTGFLWTMFGKKPHGLDGLSLLPTNTAMATFSDLDLALLWSVIQKQTTELGIPQASAMLDKLPQGFEQATGLKWDQVLASLGGEFGVVITLDESKTISIPLPGNQPMEIPEPGLLLAAKVKDDTIFNRIDEALKMAGQQIVRVDKPNLKMRTMPLPLPLPIQLRPTVATSEGYLLIATTDTLIQNVLAIKAGQAPGLKSTAEFQRLAKGVPEQGNQFTFLSQRFGQTRVQVQRQALQMSGKAPPALQSLLQPGDAAFAFTVSGNTDSGWLSVGNGNQHPAKTLLAAAVVPVAVIAAIAIPNFIKAREAAKRNQ